MMRKYFVLLFSLTAFMGNAQTFFYGGIGSMNYNGDLQKPRFTFGQTRAALTLGANIRIRNHLSVNPSLSYGSVGAMDAKGAWPRRNLSFKSNIFETAVTLEGDLRDLRNYDYGNINFEKTDYLDKFTPYIFAGIGLFHFNPYAYDKSGSKVYLKPLSTEGQGLPEYPDRKPYSLWSVCIPFGIGAKYALNEKMQVGLELSFRKTLTDYIDDISSYDYADTSILKQEKGELSAQMSLRAYEVPNSDYNSKDEYRGNPNKNDGFYTLQVKFFYHFRGSRFTY